MESKYIVCLKSRGDPAKGQNPKLAIYGIDTLQLPVPSFEAAIAACSEYILFYRLNQRQWAGGFIRERLTGRVLHRVNYLLQLEHPLPRITNVATLVAG